MGAYEALVGALGRGGGCSGRDALEDLPVEQVHARVRPGLARRNSHFLLCFSWGRIMKRI